MNRLLWATCTVLAIFAVPGCGGDDDTGSGGSNGGAGGNGGVGASSGSGGDGGSATGGNGGASGSGGSAASGGNGGSGGSAADGGSAGGGGDAGSGGSAGFAGMAGAAGAGNPKTCVMLNDEYVTAIDAAKKCAYGTNPNPCTTKLKGDLECQCPTYVNPANAAAIAEVASIEAAWVAKGCTANPGCLCAEPTAGACYAGPGGPANGICQDG
jgi:hypothetical protein